MDLDTSALVAKVNSQSLLNNLDTDPNINYLESDNVSIQSADGDAFENDNNYLDQEDYVIESPEACLSNNICVSSPSCPDSTVEISSDLNLSRAKLHCTDQSDYFADCDFKTNEYFKSNECDVDSSCIVEENRHQLLYEKEVNNREDVLNYQQIISNGSPSSSADFISPESILETNSELLDVPDKSELSRLEFEEYLLTKDIGPHFIVENYSNYNEKVEHNLNENNIDTGDMGIENAWNEEFSVPSTSSYPLPLPAPLESNNFNDFSTCNNFDGVEHSSYTSDLEALFSTNEVDSDVADPIAVEGVCGLRNLGNTCFMSAGLQCLAATVSLVRYFNTKLSSSDLDENSLTLQFTELIQKMWSGQYSVVHPMKFKQALGAYYPQFKDCRQHDCQEFLALLLDALHQQLVALPKAVSGDEKAFKEKMDVSTDYPSSLDTPAKNLSDFMNNNNNNNNNSSSSSSNNNNDSNSNSNLNNNNEIIASADSTSSNGENLDYARMDVPGDMFSPKPDDNGNEAVACDSTGNDCDEKLNYMDDIFKEAKTSNINVLVTQSEANNEICFDSEKFPKKERRRNISKTNNCDTYSSLTNSLQKNSDSFCDPEASFGDDLDLKRIKVNHLNKEKNCFRKNEKNSNRPLEKNVRIENEWKMKVQNVRPTVSKRNNMDVEEDRDVICLENEAQPLKIQIHNVHSKREENAMETEEDRDVVDGGLEVQTDDEETASSMSEDLLTEDVMAEAKLNDKNIFNNKNLAFDSCKTPLKNTNKRKMKELNERVKSTRENIMETEDDRDVAESATEPATDEDVTNSSLSEEEFQTDDIEAEKHWENHIYNNRSIVFDSFQGQFKNTVVCSACNYRSVTYEPFMYLSVPLPHAIEKQLCVTFISANANPPVQYLITLIKQDEVSKIKHHLTKVVADEIKHPVVIGEVFDHHIAKILDDNHQIRYLDDVNRSIYAFEQICVLPKEKNEMDSCDSPSASGDNETVNSMSETCTICLEEKESDIKQHKGCDCILCDTCIMNYQQHQGEKNIRCPVCRSDLIPERDLVPIEQRDMKPNTRLLNVPLVYRVDKMADGNNNQKSVSLFGHPALLKLPNQISGAELYEVVKLLHAYKEPFKLLLVDGQGRHCSRCMYNQHCKGCTISQDGYVSLRTEDTLAVTFLDDVREVCEVRDPSMTFQRAYKTLSLYDCVQAFSQSEILDEFNPWFCPRCEKNQCATKTLSVWRFPNYLIVYLKRFVFHECNSIKLDDKVMFPLHDFILNSKKSSSYDLYACVCHTGGVSVGHYIAYTRHPATNEWHCFNDENVSKQKPPEEEYCNAYILFYKKKGFTCEDLLKKLTNMYYGCKGETEKLFSKETILGISRIYEQGVDIWSIFFELKLDGKAV